MNDLITNGFYINKQKFTFEISQIICDVPAKAFILNVKQFNAYHGCNSRTEEGTFLNRMTFLRNGYHIYYIAKLFLTNCK